MNGTAAPLQSSEITTASLTAETLAAMRSGRTLLLSSTPGTGLGTAALAEAALMLALGQDADHRLLRGFPPTLQGVIDDGPSSIHHELRWLAAGDLHEQFLTLGDWADAVTHVVALDPWALGVARAPSMDTASRILVANLGVLQRGAEGEYWSAYATWLAGQGVDLVIPPTELLDLLAPAFWTQHELLQAATLPEPGTSDRRAVIEESDQRPSSSQGLRRLVGELGSSHQILLITPHLAQYRDECADVLTACTAAWHPADLAVPVYTAVLASAELYVAPTGRPPGAYRLASLRPEARTWEGNATEPFSICHSIDVEPPPLPAEVSRAPDHTAPARTQFEEDPVITHDHADALSAWWPRLGMLQQEARRLEPASSVPSPASIDFAILLCCHKFLQRFRIFMQSVVRQKHPLERLEICIAASGNPDGLHEYVDLLRIAHPELSLILVDIPQELAGNKGKMLNAAFRSSTASVVMTADCDLVLPTDFVTTMLAQHRTDRIIGCWRTPMSEKTTAQIITGDLDPVAHFAALRQQWDKREETAGVRQGMLGYCQVVSREAFDQVHYPEEFEGFGQSDIVFVERLNAIGVHNHFMKDYFVLHLAHHRDWTGTKVFL